MNDSFYTIGELAKISGIAVRRIRFLEIVEHDPADQRPLRDTLERFFDAAAAGSPGTKSGQIHFHRRAEKSFPHDGANIDLSPIGSDGVKTGPSPFSAMLGARWGWANLSQRGIGA